MPDLSREQFFDRVLEIVRGRFPLAKLSRGPQNFSVRLNGHVASLENLYRVAVLRPAELTRHVERWALELLRVAEGSPDQTAGYEELSDRIMPLLIGQPIEPAVAEDKLTSADVSPPGLGAVLSQPLVSNLQIAYVIDSDRSMSYIPPGALERWGVSIDDLHAQAIKNLVGRSDKIAAHAAKDENDNVNLILFQTMDGYDATRLLLPSLHDRLREHLGSPFLAGVPNRDILLCFREDEEAVSRLKNQITEDFRSMPNSISDKLVLVTADGIAAYS